MSEFVPGISVILPSFQGIQYLPRVLESLVDQTLDASLYEVVLVLNGPDDGSKNFVEEFRKLNPSIEIIVLESLQPGASRARNIGLSGATRQYITFVDVDDALESRFLETAFKIGRASCRERV